MKITYDAAVVINTLLMPKRTFQPTKRKRHKKTGFLSRMKTLGGRKIILGRRRKKRATLGVR